MACLSLWDFLVIKDTPLIVIQVLYSSLIRNINLGLLFAIDTAEDGIMDQDISLSKYWYVT